ncbi:hypothetical protein L4D08_22145 [Photobacterium chitinilyticum]|uniref:hypothetical protein n=1 Tax=Photobacterium chitinilyticum TaxID=2485123 RepID=UPI003D14BFB2
MSNLLAKHCNTVIRDMRFADIYILLGMGEAHGDAAYRWTFEDINDQFSVKEEGKVEQVASFEAGKKTIFSDYLGNRTAFRSNFADQHVIPRTLDLDSVSTRLCTDSPLITWLFALLKKTGGSKILKFRAVQDYLIKLLTLFPFGTDQYVVKVEAGSSRDTGILYECSVSGNGEGHITGLVAAKVAEELHISSFEPGVFHIEQLFEPLPFIESLASTAEYRALTRWHLPVLPSRNISYKVQCTIDYEGKSWATPNRFAGYSPSRRTACYMRGWQILTKLGF